MLSQLTSLLGFGAAPQSLDARKSDDVAEDFSAVFSGNDEDSRRGPAQRSPVPGDVEIPDAQEVAEDDSAGEADLDAREAAPGPDPFDEAMDEPDTLKALVRPSDAGSVENARYVESSEALVSSVGSERGLSEGEDLRNDQLAGPPFTRHETTRLIDEETAGPDPLRAGSPQASVATALTRGPAGTGSEIRPDITDAGRRAESLRPRSRAGVGQKAEQPTAAGDGSAASGLRTGHDAQSVRTAELPDMPVFRMERALGAGASMAAGGKRMIDSGAVQQGAFALPTSRSETPLAPGPHDEAMPRLETAANLHSGSGRKLGQQIHVGTPAVKQDVLSRLAGRALPGLAAKDRAAATGARGPAAGMSLSPDATVSVLSPSSPQTSPAAPFGPRYDAGDRAGAVPVARKGSLPAGPSGDSSSADAAPDGILANGSRAIPDLSGQIRRDLSPQAGGALRLGAVRSQSVPLKAPQAEGSVLIRQISPHSLHVPEEAEAQDHFDREGLPVPTGNRALASAVPPAKARASGGLASGGLAAIGASIRGSGGGGRPSGQVTSPFLADLIDEAAAEELHLPSASHDPRVTPSSFPGSAAPPVRADANPILRQVAEGFARLADGSVDIRLSPEELGHVRLQMVASESGLTVHITADRPETLDLMRRHIDQLARDLADAGYEGAEFSFAGGSNRDDRPGPRSGGPAADPAETPTQQDPAQALAADGLDLRV